jgi:pimeloyl-ACP methyl ester carboxylesterase
MTEFSFECLSDGGGAFDVIFIHGLGGDPRATWRVGPASECWPDWLQKDLLPANIYLLGYPTDVIATWLSGEMSLYERAKAVLDHLAARGLGKRPMAIIAHSLGGLLGKQLIRTGYDAPDEDWKAIATSCKLMMFLGTPHSGSSVASALGFVAPKLSSKMIALLQNGNEHLDELNEWYRNRDGVKTVVYYEKLPTRGIQIVSQKSADPGVAGTIAVPVDANHLTICKPINRDATIYLSTKRHLEKLATQCVMSSNSPQIGEEPALQFIQDDYVAATLDRRDLQQKLIDAGKEHEYPLANDAQNKFAQNYMRLGLHTSARRLNDSLLAEVKQRFETHVYHAKICHGAPEEITAAALQSAVIDPIVNKYGTEYGATPLTVMQAVYFLAEQCHIRWDAA